MKNIPIVVVQLVLITATAKELSQAGANIVLGNYMLRAISRDEEC